MMKSLDELNLRYYHNLNKPQDSINVYIDTYRLSTNKILILTT